MVAPDDDTTLPPDGRAPGWFGKLPALGDFAGRRLPRGFTEAWDAWLSRGLAASRDALGDRWLDVYLDAPVWRFALGAGVLDEHHWLGVMMPSVDRVGRYFPLTVAAPFAHWPAPPLAAAAAWLDALTAAVLACLADGGTVARFEAHLAAAGVPRAAPAVTMPARSGEMLRLPHAATLGDALSPLAAAQANRALRGHSLWWPWRQAGQGVAVSMCRGLPDAHRFVGLLEATA